MHNNRCRRRGATAAAFGIGLIVAFCCPQKALIFILAIALVLLGIAFIHQ